MLIHSPNCLGDVVMALPPFRAWRDRHAEEPVHILAKRRVAAIWGFVRDIDSVIVLDDGRDGARAAREAIRSAKCDEAILLPQSFRSAWIVWRAGVGNIRGTVSPVVCMATPHLPSLRTAAVQATPCTSLSTRTLSSSPRSRAS